MRDEERKMIEQKMEGGVREVACWVALMMSEGYRGEEHKAHREVERPGASGVKGGMCGPEKERRIFFSVKGAGGIVSSSP